MAPIKRRVTKMTYLMAHHKYLVGWIVISVAVWLLVTLIYYAV